MKAKLIKIKEGEYILVTLHKNLPQWFKIAFEVGDGYYAFASNTLIGGIKTIDEIHSVSLRNCQAIERGYDLDELAKEYVKETDDIGTKYLSKVLGDNNSTPFKKGFQKALEILGDKRFSEKDMIGFAKWRKDSDDKYEQIELLNIWQSLQQTEWEVEIDMEPYHDGNFEDDGKTHSFEPKWRPTLDEDGCLILRLA